MKAFLKTKSGFEKTIDVEINTDGMPPESIKIPLMVGKTIIGAGINSFPSSHIVEIDFELTAISPIRNKDGSLKEPLAEYDEVSEYMKKPTLDEIRNFILKLESEPIDLSGVVWNACISKYLTVPISSTLENSTHYKLRNWVQMSNEERSPPGIIQSRD